ncbi:hypothetical protein EDD16DRAFT_1524381 [Pisolithus croceorrhizus]|nr:hypothetical protein EV401DRAFT_1895825 [Pisolithus croceorrhizus]KAI6105152.1 hypothetical protein EDD16DRAFT_1524381 [Pisolithus croceorrhizus]
MERIHTACGWVTAGQGSAISQQINKCTHKLQMGDSRAMQVKHQQMVSKSTDENTCILWMDKGQQIPYSSLVRVHTALPAGKHQQIANRSKVENAYILWMRDSRESISKGQQINRRAGSSNGHQINKWQYTLSVDKYIIVRKASANGQQINSIIAVQGSTNDQYVARGKYIQTVEGKGSQQMESMGRVRKLLVDSKVKAPTSCAWVTARKESENGQQISKEEYTQTVDEYIVGQGERVIKWPEDQ